LAENEKTLLLAVTPMILPCLFLAETTVSPAREEKKEE
jgi:hypothetical protein